ncbi:hypothetical protein HA402_010676 [Bradysia odoriphaga]|nr:hypothetical protein HA402_010676 [Bradysia odoriphaga]
MGSYAVNNGVVADKLLYHFGQKGLKPSEQFQTEGKRLAQKVFLMLQKCLKKYSVAEPYFGGSFGKKTYTINPDLDLVIVVNNVDNPPYEDVLEQFEDILLQNERKLEISSGSIKRKSKFSLQFLFNNGMDVDLLPATKKTPEQVYTILEQKPDMFYSYSSSLVKKQIDFMTSHDSSFVHIIIRIVKYWFKSLSFGEKHFNGKGIIMELLGIAAAGLEENTFNSGSLSVVRTLRRVLVMVEKIDSIKLAFEQIPETKKWIRIPESKLKIQNSHQLIPRIVGTKNILSSGFFIIEPANPFNNLMGGQDETVIQKLKEYAGVTKERLSLLMNGQYTNLNGVPNQVIVDVINKVFEPQPVCLKNQFSLEFPVDFIISYSYPYSSEYCDMEVRNEEPIKRKEVELAVESIKWRLLSVVTVVKTNDDVTPTDIKNAIDPMVKSTLDVQLTASTMNNHEEHDISLSVPYKSNGKTYAVKFSMSWSWKS